MRTCFTAEERHAQGSRAFRALAFPGLLWSLHETKSHITWHKILFCTSIRTHTQEENNNVTKWRNETWVTQSFMVLVAASIPHHETSWTSVCRFFPWKHWGPCTHSHINTILFSSDPLVTPCATTAPFKDVLNGMSLCELVSAETE